MTDNELIEQIKLTFPDYFYSQVADRKAKEIAELCKEHYRKIVIDAVRADSNSRMTEYTIEAINKALE